MPSHDRPEDKHPARQHAHAPGNAGVTLTVPQAMERAVAAYHGGNWKEAERLCRLILDTQADFFDALHFLGIIAAQTGRAKEAAELLSRAVAIHPNHPQAHNNLGNVLRDLKRPAEALQSYDRALAIKRDYAEALSNRGNALVDLNRHHEALQSYDRALGIRPNYPEALNNRAGALRALNRHAEALQNYDRALAIKPDYAEGLFNRGRALCDLRRPDEAIRSYDRALEISPDHRSARSARALCLLQVGDFARGWPEYESRWTNEDPSKNLRTLAQPAWLGREPLEGKTILLHAEQGFGDTLQFCRYAAKVAALGAKVILEVQPQLLPVLARLEGATQVMPRGATLPAFDCHCPLLSLPLAFKTEMHTIPADVPYIRSEATRVDTWRERLGKTTRPRVGVAWSGTMVDPNRALALAQVLPLMSDRFEWVSLQKEVPETDADLLASRPDIRHFGDRLQDFADTAALVELMDVVISVDTAVAHLAGAMGKVLWLLLQFNADWRWLLDREDSVWYPTARLFRQPAIGDWTSVIDRVRLELPQHFRVQSNR